MRSAILKYISILPPLVLAQRLRERALSEALFKDSVELAPLLLVEVIAPVTDRPLAQQDRLGLLARHHRIETDRVYQGRAFRRRLRGWGGGQ